MRQNRLAFNNIGFHVENGQSLKVKLRSLVGRWQT